MSTITIGADVDLKTNSKALKIDTLNHYSNGGNASAWLDNTNFSGYTENADANSEYPLTGALAALATYAATVGPSATVDTSFDTADNVHPATQAAIQQHLTSNFAAKEGNNGVSFKAADLIMTSTSGDPATITDDGSDGITIGNASTSNACYIKVTNDAVAVYKQGNSTALFEVSA